MKTLKELIEEHNDIELAEKLFHMEQMKKPIYGRYIIGEEFFQKENGDKLTAEKLNKLINLK